MKVIPLLVTLGATLALGSSAWAQKSPVGTWEFQVSGKLMQGVAYFTFYDNYEFIGHELITSFKTSPPNPNEQRYPNGDPGGRYPTKPSGSTTNTPAVNTITNLYGFGTYNGPWTYDNKGNLIGYFTQVVNGGNGQKPSYNSVSFKGKVTPGKRLSMTASTANGKVTYSGIPKAGYLPDFTGSWHSKVKKGKQTFIEMFTVEPDPDFDYLFTVKSGGGGGYAFDGGHAMITSRKKAGFTFNVLGTGASESGLRAVVGTFDSKKFRVWGRGTDDGENISFDATKYAD